MNLSLEFLDRCSAETGFQVAALEKVVRIGEIAGDQPSPRGSIDPDAHQERGHRSKDTYSSGLGCRLELHPS